MADTPKAEITRSPRYPQFSLGDALDKIRDVYKKEERHKVPKEAIAKSIGYKSINGASLGAIATLKQFGLLETVADSLRVSDDAVTILELPKGNAERSEAIVKVAFSPKIFADLKEEYGDRLPSDETVRLNLIRKGYKKYAVDVIIRTFRETLALVADEKGGYNAGEAGRKEDEERNAKPAGETPMQQPPPAFTGQPSMEQQREWASGRTSSHFALHHAGTGQPVEFRKMTRLAFKLSRGSDAEVVIYGDATQEAITKLTALLELSQDTFPTKEELERPQPRSAMWKNKDHDQPVTVTGELGAHDGKRFFSIAESSSGIPEDELTFDDEGAA